MTYEQYPDNPYILLTPGPLSASKSVKATMLRDWCTWDNDYNSIVQEIRRKLVSFATTEPEKYTSVLMQGSGTFSVESVVGSIIPDSGKLLVLANGAYGKRIAEIADYLKINYSILDFGELNQINATDLENVLNTDKDITHVAVAHCETTTGMLNPIKEIGETVYKYGKIYLVDAMSSFGGIPMDMDDCKIDVLVSSANKCIQGVPGFGFTICKRSLIENLQGIARSLSLDLYSQWKTMEEQNGKWRFTSPTHTVRAFQQALVELDEEGGIAVRYKRYRTNQSNLVLGMKKIGFKPLLPEDLHSPIITTFLSPESSSYKFNDFYHTLKKQGFVIYPGKVTDYQCFRIGNIGEVYPEDIDRLIHSIEAYCISFDIMQMNRNGY